MSKYTVIVEGKSYAVEVKGRQGTTLSITIDGAPHSVSVTPTVSTSARVSQVSSPAPRPIATPSSIGNEQRSSPNEVCAPIPGIVSEIKVATGQAIESGATLVVVEAMKMENPIRAHRAGIIKVINVAKGDEIARGVVLVTLEECG